MPKIQKTDAEWRASLTKPNTASLHLLWRPAFPLRGQIRFRLRLAELSHTER